MLIHEKDIKRFWSKVDIKSKNECWEWQASLKNKQRNTYGQFNLAGYMRLAHRLAYMSTHKMKDKNNLVLHKCNNKKCVNPNHLYEGDHSDNLKDYYNSDSLNYYKGKLTEEDVRVIKKLLKNKSKRGFFKELAKIYKVSPRTISHINTGNSWRHVEI